MHKTEAVVIGAGVVGLACARALSKLGLEVVILEKNVTFGTETSSRNSEVVHAGIYYRPGSEKANLCVLGKRLLYTFCEKYHVPYLKCGKLIVAASLAQLSSLEKIENQARANEVFDLDLLDRHQLTSLEPELKGVAALFSPSTGIIDSHAFMLALLGEAERGGAVLASRSEVTSAIMTPEGLALTINNEPQASLHARYVVNSAGLHSISVARSIVGVLADSIPTSLYAKGSYFSLAGRIPFTHLIYPLPEPGGLGVHLTLDLAGKARFGPDVEWVDSIDYQVEPSRGEEFYRAIRSYWPALKDGALQPAYAGIRSKIAGPGEPDGDFNLQDQKTHGVPGLINLYGIESPGLTASLAIGERVAQSLLMS
jgi:L-2-hydroxyglutarate oxidase LhgO